MLYAIIAAIVLVADQWLKYWVTVNITLATGEIGLIPGVVKLVNIHNSGAAFGMLSKVSFARWLFLGIAVLFIIAVIVLLAKKVFKSRFANWCIVLAMAGAVGNCIDRLLYGYVVDMFKLQFMNFAIFNVADIVLVVACLLFIVALFTTEREYEDEDEEYEDESEEDAEVAEEAEAPVSDEHIAVAGIESTEPEFPETAKRLVPDDEPVSDDELWAKFKNDLRKPSNEPAKKSAEAVKPEAPKAAPKKAAPVKEEFDLDSIMAEFKDI